MSRISTGADSSISESSIVSPVPYDLPKPSRRRFFDEGSRESFIFNEESSAGSPILEPVSAGDSSRIQVGSPHESRSFSFSQDQFVGSLSALSRGGSSESENDAQSIEGSRSGSSGITIYSDAQESLKDEQTRIEEHSRGMRSSAGPGLVSVTPLKSALRDSSLSTGTFDFGLNSANEALATSYAASPTTPRLRRGSPDRHIARELFSYSVRESSERTHRTVHEHSPRPKKAREPLGSLDNRIPPTKLAPGNQTKSTNYSFGKPKEEQTKKQTKKQKGKGLTIELGRPRVPSANPSLASTHGSSRADSQGHIEPSRKVKEPQLSYVRRTKGLIYSQGPIYAGGPRAPLLPFWTQSSAFEVGGTEKNIDIWGRTAASWWVSVLMLCGCILFPPLWLLLAVGYFDHLFGPILRWVKVLALMLALATLAAGTALVVVFAVVH